MPSKTPSSRSVAQARRALQQLRVEAGVQRVKVSKAALDLMLYCRKHAKHDPLLTGIDASDDPYRDRKSCALL